MEFLRNLYNGRMATERWKLGIRQLNICTGRQIVSRVRTDVVYCSWCTYISLFPNTFVFYHIMN